MKLKDNSKDKFLALKILELMLGDVNVSDSDYVASKAVKDLPLW